MPAKGQFIAPPQDLVARIREFDSDEDVRSVRMALAKHYGRSPETVDRWLEGATSQTFTEGEIPKGRAKRMLEDRELDPEEWRISSLGVNEWTMANGDVAVQTKFTVKPVGVQIRPARVDGWKPPKPKPKLTGSSWTDVITGDLQVPYQDTAFHSAMLSMLADVKPRRIVDDGDLPDFPSVSKYPKKAEWNASVNECIEGSYRVWCDRRSASPDSECVQLEGNHCKRLADKIARDFEEGAGIRRAGEEESVLSLPHLLRLDELSVEYVGNYPHNIYKLSDDTAVIHGDKVKSGSGATGLATLLQRGYNVFVGHIHRQSITEHTWHDIDGNPFTRYAIEVGAGCSIREGLGHTVNPDWQIGAATATFFKDGTFLPELIMWDGKYLTWRGERWR